MNSVLWVALGGGLGSVLRYLLSQWIGLRSNGAFPWATFGVNLIGCAAIGVCWALLSRYPATHPLRLFFISGLLGGFTTFSAFGLETFQLLQARQWLLAALYTGGSTLAAISVLFLFYQSARAL